MLHKKVSDWKPVAYASRSLTEMKWGGGGGGGDIDRKVSTVSCEKFSDFILKKKFEIETDHKSLVPLLSSKH